MKANKNTLLLIFAILLLMIGAVFVLTPKGDDPLKPILEDPQQQQRVLVYFSKNKGSEIVTESVARPLPQPRPESNKEILTLAMTELLAGPTSTEEDAGYFSEIPEGTRLIAVIESPSRIEINLSEEFVSGGGSNSMVQRLAEITKTVVSVHQKKPVYLQVEGKPLETLGGEGVMVHEPITEEPSVAQ